MLLGSLLKLAFVLLLLQLLHIFLATTYVYIFNGAKLVKTDDRWMDKLCMTTYHLLGVDLELPSHFKRHYSNCCCSPPVYAFSRPKIERARQRPAQKEEQIMR